MQTINPESTMQPMSNRESGSVLVIALIMLVLLTIIGISASKTSEIEIMIAGNERVAKENFYLAEGGARRAVMAMENADLKNNVPSWVYEEVDPSDTSKTEYQDIATGVNLLPASKQDRHMGSYGLLDVESLIHEDDNWEDPYPQLIPGMGTDTRILAIKKGLAPGADIGGGPGVPKPIDFAVYGRSVHKNGLGLVVVGYRKAY